MSEAKVTIGDWECVDTQDTLGKPLRIATRRGRYTKYYAQIESSGRFTGNGGDIGIPADVVAWLAGKEAAEQAWVDERLAMLEIRRREGRHLLQKAVRQLNKLEPGNRFAVQVADYLNRTHVPTDVLRDADGLRDEPPSKTEGSK